MATLFERTIRRGELEYRITTDFDDAAIMDNEFRVTIEGAVRRLPAGTWRPVTLELVGNMERALIEVYAEERLIGTIHLDLPIEEAKDLLGNGLDIEATDEIIEEELGPLAIEEIIHLIPGDPFLGCLLKGALSTVVGQTIRCWRKSSTDLAVAERIGEIGGCLREYGLRMALTFMYRAGRCTLLIGLG